jgi:hypothetical protein
VKEQEEYFGEQRNHGLTITSEGGGGSSLRSLFFEDEEDSEGTEPGGEEELWSDFNIIWSMESPPLGVERVDRVRAKPSTTGTTRVWLEPKSTMRLVGRPKQNELRAAL